MGRSYIDAYECCSMQWNKTSLMFACEIGHLDVALFLIDKGADVNAQGFVSFIDSH